MNRNIKTVAAAIALSLVMATPAIARTPHGWTGDATRTVGPNMGYSFGAQRSITGNSANSTVTAAGPNGRLYQSGRSSSYGNGTGSYNHDVTTGNGNSFAHDYSVTKNGNGSATVNQTRSGPWGGGSTSSRTYQQPTW
jgi:hypothetical protein